MTDEPNANVVPDFIFGTLATDALRVESIQQERRGLWHNGQLQPLDPRPGDPITITVQVGPDVVADHVALYYTTNGTTPSGQRGHSSNGTVIRLERLAVEWDTLVWGYYDHYAGVIPPQPDGVELRYIIESWQSLASASQYIGGTHPQVFGFTVDRATVPAWLRTGVIYQIFVDRYAPSPGSPWATPADPLGGFYGGTLQGITSHLDDLADLGVTCLWLTPIFPSPSHHGYDATDYATIDPRFGTLSDFDALVAGVHARGMRIILDYVANHLSSQHPAFIAAQMQRNAPTTSWFTFTSWPEKYSSFFNVDSMPQFNTDDPAARAYLIDNACEWLRRGADGFRLDYANGPSHAFWSSFRTATRGVNPESVMFGEVVETPQLQRSYTGRMDGCLDFMLLQNLRSFFAFRSLLPSQFDRFLDRHTAFFNTDFVLPSFLDNHDMNRFLWTVGGDERRLRLAALCQFTLPGPPIIYYGTEVGMNQRRDVRYPDGSGHPEESRLPMVWGSAQNQPLRHFYQQLVALRRSGGTIWQGQRTPILIDDPHGIYAYRCGDYVVVLNNSPDRNTVTLPHPVSGIMVATAPEIALGPHGQLVMPPFAGVCLQLTRPRSIV